MEDQPARLRVNRIPHSVIASAKSDWTPPKQVIDIRHSEFVIGHFLSRRRLPFHLTSRILPP
jgi:hypothetical protein